MVHTGWINALDSDQTWVSDPFQRMLGSQKSTAKNIKTFQNS